MRLASYVQKRSSGYYYRQRVPAALKPLLGQTELCLSLKTRRIASANRRAALVMASVNQMLEDVYRLMDQFGHAEAKALAENWKRQALNQDFENRLAGTVTPPDDSPETLRQSLAQMDFRSRKDFINSVTRERAPFLEPETQSWRRAGYYLLQARLEYLEEIMRRSSGDNQHLEYLEEPAHSISNVHASTSPSVNRISEMLIKWERDGQRPDITIQEWRLAIRRFIDLKGDKTVETITPADIREFKEALLQVPKRVARNDRSLPMPQLIAKYRKNNCARLHPASINKILAAVRSVLSWCIKNGYIDRNPALGIAAPLPKVSAKSRLPFDSEDLKAIFEKSPVYLGQARHPKCGIATAYWLPLMALYTGARLEELGQLRLTDVKQQDDLWYLDINVDGEGKSLKTSGSMRQIPLHPKLLELGFISYIASIQRLKHTHLFPHLNHHQEKCTRQFSKWINKYISQDCGVEDTRKVFHSFRHTFKDACRNAGIPRDKHDALTGHADSAVSSRYGVGFQITVLYEEIKNIDYPISVTPWTTPANSTIRLAKQKLR
ncbi:site-specific integrase [Cerasicoccus arenae]|nr:site-specific integrase [Cerasicoccus arenae]